MTKHSVNKKQASESTRARELENDLIEKEVNQQTLVDSGKDGKLPGDGTPVQVRATETLRAFQIQQGHRRRHPLRVLNTFAGVRGSSSGVSSMWEKDLTLETEQYKLDPVFNKQDVGMSNQLGISGVASKNFLASAPKLSQMYLVGS